MAKFAEKIKAQALRKKGKSIKQIARTLKLSKSTVSVWCRDIELSPKQIQALNNRRATGGYEGRIKGARMQHERKLALIRQYEIDAEKFLGNLSQREFFLAGIGLYWGEGGKVGHRVKFANADPILIRFIMKWFREILEIPNDKFRMYVIINAVHKHRIKKIESFWSRTAGCPKDQFYKAFFIQAKNKKVYANSEKYYGTLHIEVRKSSQAKYKVLGFIKALGDYTQRTEISRAA